MIQAQDWASLEVLGDMFFWLRKLIVAQSS